MSKIRSFLNSRFNVILYFILPYIIAMATYYHYGDSLSSQTISWTEIIKNENVKPIEEIEQKQFGDILITHDSKSIPSETLDSLLIQYGIDPSANNDLKQGLSMQQKIDLLLKISSPDFWRKNYELHPKHSRIKTWISVHKRYLRQIKRISEISKPNKLKKAFVKYVNKIKSSLEFHLYHLTHPLALLLFLLVFHVLLVINDSNLLMFFIYIII
eukprot:340568_1